MVICIYSSNGILFVYFLFSLNSVQMQPVPPDGLNIEDSTEDDPDVRLSIKEEDKR